MRSSNNNATTMTKYRVYSYLFLLPALAVSSTTFSTQQQQQRYLQKTDYFPTDASTISSSQQQNNSECPLTCLGNSTCTRGDQNLAGHPTRPADGSPLDFHAELNRNGWHCACPEGLTGLQCDRPFETCNDGEHVCYHNGQCIPGLLDVYGNTQLFCDCTMARDDIDDDNDNNENTNDELSTTRYMGKYCEQKIDIDVEKCTYNGKKSGEVCANGGTCKVFPNPQDPCICPPGFHGKHCEFVDGSVPDCSKPCINGGFCRLGNKDGIATSSSSLDPHNVQHCECSAQYYGEYCEHEAERCGERFCYHGSKCFEILLSDGSTEHLCDCTPAFTRQHSYAGQYCQYESTSFCSGIDDPNGRQFCTNGGTCGKNNHDPCTCVDGYSGPRCAYHIENDNDGTDNSYSTCSLQCQNGGTCQKGIKDLQLAFGKFADDVEHLVNQTSHEDFEHCVCPDGYFGIKCEYQMEQCGENEHLCLHGSTCVENKNSDNSFECNCKDSQDQTAGLFCEFFATEQCPISSTVHQIQNDDNDDEKYDNDHRGFCTNGGQCVVDDQGFTRCRCAFGYEGPHCEFRVPITELPDYSSFHGHGFTTGTKLGIVCTIAAFVMGVIWCVLATTPTNDNDDKNHNNKETSSRGQPDGIISDIDLSKNSKMPITHYNEDENIDFISNEGYDEEDYYHDYYHDNNADTKNVQLSSAIMNGRQYHSSNMARRQQLLDRDYEGKNELSDVQLL